MNDARHEVGRAGARCRSDPRQPRRADRRAQSPAARRPGPAAAVPRSRRPAVPGRRRGRSRWSRAASRWSRAPRRAARRSLRASGRPPREGPAPRLAHPEHLAERRPSVPRKIAAAGGSARGGGDRQADSPGASVVGQVNDQSAVRARAAAGACSRLADDAAEAEVAGRRVDRLRPCARPAGSAGNSWARRGTSPPSSPCAESAAARSGSKLRSRAPPRGVATARGSSAPVDAGAAARTSPWSTPRRCRSCRRGPSRSAGNDPTGDVPS